MATQPNPVWIPPNKQNTPEQNATTRAAIAAANPGNRTLQNAANATAQNIGQPAPYKILNPAEQQAARDTAMGSALKVSQSINNYGATTPEQIAAQEAINVKYGLPKGTGIYGNGGLAKAPLIPRNLAAEKAVVDQYWPPQIIDEAKNYNAQVYTKNELAHKIETGQIPMSMYNEQELKDLGLTADRMQHIADLETDPARKQRILGMLDKLKALGTEGDMAKDVLNANPAPTNNKLNILSEALNASSNYKNQQLGKSELFKMAGLGGYSVLQQSLAQRADEMKQKLDSAQGTLSLTSGAMLDAFKVASDLYKQTQENYNKQMERLLKIDEQARDIEAGLDLAEQRHKYNLSEIEWTQQMQQKYSEKGIGINDGASIYGSDTGSSAPNYKITSTKIGGKTISGQSVFLTALQKADAAMFAATGKHIQIGEHFRTNEKQKAIRAKFGYTSDKQPSGYNGLPMAAPPGTSFHEKGLAIDVSNWKEAAPYLAKYGIVSGLKNDMNHFSMGEMNPGIFKDIKSSEPNYAEKAIKNLRQGKLATASLDALASIGPGGGDLGTAALDFLASLKPKDKSFAEQLFDINPIKYQAIFNPSTTEAINKVKNLMSIPVEKRDAFIKSEKEIADALRSSKEITTLNNEQKAKIDAFIEKMSSAQKAAIAADPAGAYSALLADGNDVTLLRGVMAKMGFTKSEYLE